MEQLYPKRDRSNSWQRDVLLLLLILGSLFFILLGSRPLFVPDEGRYAEIAREMFATKDFITPHLNSIKYFEKPILFYWLESAAIAIGGLNLWSLRSLNALLGLIGCLMTYGFARKLYGGKTGFLSALILGTSTLYFVMVRMITLDISVTVFLMSCLYCFYLGMLCNSHMKRFYCWSGFIFAAFATLSKGLIGIVFPLLILSCWLTIIGQWRVLKDLYLPSGIFIFLIIVLPWHLLVTLRNPEFFYFYFITQHFLRYTEKHVGHYQPIWFFIPYLALGFFPWIVFFPQTIIKFLKEKSQQTYQTEHFLLIWIIVIFVFFSFSQSKLIPYILPLFPPLAILVAHYLQESIVQKSYRGIKIGFSLLLFCAAVILGSYHLFLTQSSLVNLEKAKVLLYTAAIIFAIGICCLFYYPVINFRFRLSILVATTWLFLLTSFAAFPAIDTRTILPLANILKPLLTPQTEVITFNKYYQDLPFYIERRISILNWQNELTYGMAHQDTKDWMIDDDTFWERWHSKNRTFAIISLDEYHQLRKNYPNEKLFLLGKTLENALISNQV